MSVAPSGPKDPRIPEFPEILTPTVIQRNKISEQFNKHKAMPDLPPPHNRVAEDGPLTREGVWYRRDHMQRLGQRPSRESLLDRSFYSTDELLEEHLAEKQAEWDSKTQEYETWDEPGGIDGSTMWDVLVQARNKRWDKQSAYYAQRLKIKNHIEKSELAAGTHHTQMSKKPRWVEWEENAREIEAKYQAFQKQQVIDDESMEKFIESERIIDEDVKNYRRYRRWERAINDGEKWSDVMNDLYPPWEQGDPWEVGKSRMRPFGGRSLASQLPEDLQNMSDEEFSRMQASAMPRIREELAAKKAAMQRRIAQKWSSGEYYRDSSGIKQSKENDKLRAKIVASRKANNIAIQKAKKAGFMNLLGGIEDMITTQMFGPVLGDVVQEANRNVIKSIVGTAKAIDKKITSTKLKVTGAIVDTVVGAITAPARAERARIKALQDAVNKDLLRDLMERERNREDKRRSIEARKGPSLVRNHQADALEQFKDAESV